MSSSHSAVPYSAPKRKMWQWGTGTIADALMIQTFGLVLPIFNTGFGLDSVMLSWAIMIPRLVDGLMDPIIGNFSDNVQTRWGRRKPFLFVTAILGALVVAGIWWANPAWPKSWQFAYLVVFATLYYTTWGTFSMTHYALGYELTDDYHERARVMAIRTVFLQVVVLAVSWTYWLALRPVFGGEIHGIRWIASGMAVLIVITGLVPVFCCEERFAHVKRPHAPILKSIKEAFQLKPFRTYLAMRFFSAFGLVVFSQLIFYVNVYYVCAGDKSLATKIVGIGTMLTVGISIAVLPLVPKLSRWMGKRNAVIAGCAIALVQACLVPLLYNPANPYLQLVSAALTAPLVAIAIVMRDAIVPDICDLDELENGTRREALFTAVTSFVYKLEVSLCVVLVGYLLRFSAFDPKLGAAQPGEVLTRLQWFTFVPNVVFAAIALWYAIRFPITESHMAKVRDQLDERRKATAA
jgi:GPH family glycoside/pentoside/hexuronide:cation symporter